MSRNNDFYAAMAAGTLLGIGAGLLLRPRRRTARDRLLRELRPYREQLQRAGPRHVEPVEDDSPELLPLDGLEGDAIDVGRELLVEFREEVRRVLDEARDELRDLAVAAGGHGRGARSHHARDEQRPAAGRYAAADEDPYDDEDGEQD